MHSVKSVSVMTSFALMVVAFSSQAQANDQAPNEEPPVRPAETFPSYPANTPEPVKRFAKVQFISDGFSLAPGNCEIAQSSGDVDADRQACKTVSYFATPPGKMAIVSTAVWSRPTALANFVGPKLLNPEAFKAGIYPPTALRSGQQGTTVIRILVRANGKADECEVASSSGYSVLDNASCKIGLKYRYQPGQVDSQPTDSVYMTAMQFYSGAGPRSKPRELP